MKIEFEITNFENTGDLTPEMLRTFGQIFKILIEKGALTGIKNGCAKIHFDSNGRFVGVQMDYWPWRKKDSG
jgi:hypothetical protein